MTQTTHAKRVRPDRTGFTLIELLVVISIITLLLSVLLPSLGGARRTGQRVACSSQLRRIAEGASQYAQDNEDWIVGSPAGSGAYLDGETNAWGSATHPWDFMGPLADFWNMGLSTVTKGDRDAWGRRFNELRSAPAFLCPGNRFLATNFTGQPDSARTGWMISYNTCRYQLWTGSWAGVTLPGNFKPIINLIGNPANKVYCADGSRFTTKNGNEGPDFDLTIGAAGGVYGYGGPFSDTGSHSSFSRSWDRSWAPGNGGGGDRDARIFAFRHAAAEPNEGARGNAFKGNFAFYDGHVETQGDLESANPHQWLPRGTVVTGSTEFWADVQAIYGSSSVQIGG